MKGIKLIKQGNGNCQLLIPPNLSYDEFESCMDKFLSSPSTPNTVIICGQQWSFADLSNRQARMLLYDSLGGKNNGIITVS